MRRRHYRKSIKQHDYEIYHADADSFLKKLPDGFADIIFLDPPFNIGKEYKLDGFTDRGNPDIYNGWLVSIIRTALPKISQGGALFLYHIPAVAYQMANFLDTKMEFRHWIAISMKNNFVRGNRLYPAHYALLYFTKGRPKSFVRPKLKPQQCRHCGELIKDYGGYRAIVEQKGLNLSDFWDDLSPVRHNSTKKRNENELPMEVYNRVMQISGFPGANYVDPFMGSGGGLVAARNFHLNGYAGDASIENCKIAKTRIKLDNEGADK